MEPAALNNPKKDLAALAELERHLYAHRWAITGMGVYGASIDPVDASEDRAEAQAILEEEDLNLICSEETGEMLTRLSEVPELLSDTQAAEVKILNRLRSRNLDVPKDLQAQHTKLVAASDAAWRRAKPANDWASYEPHLDKVVQSMRSIAQYKNPDMDPYDVWLDEFEYGTSQAFYNEFFDEVKATVVPLFAAIRKKGTQPSRTMLEGRFDERRQWNLSHDLMALEGLDPNKMWLTKTEHPYCDSFTTNYGIIATHIYEDDVISNVYSMLHEGGHALYETGVNPAYNYTVLKGGTSSGIHEAQSRFFENYVGRSRAFMPHILELLKKHFPGQFGRVTANQLYSAVNRAEAGFIRTEADELTYPLHILIRYELEQALFAGEVTAKDIPTLWADKYESYLGIRPLTDTQGALQDTHWPDGLFGYFPTYALGGAYGAQLRHQMISEGMDFDGLLSEGNLAPVREWLASRIWQYGQAKDPEELIQAACGEPFSAKYYTEYLVEKFSALYDLREEDLH